MLIQENLPRTLSADLFDQGEVGLFSLQINDGLAWCGHEPDIAATERAINKRFLHIARFLQHLITHPSERQADVESRYEQIVYQRSGERAVIATAVLGGCAGLGGVGNQGVDATRLNRAQTGERRHALRLHCPRKRIVPESVENDDPQSLSP